MSYVGNVPTTAAFPFDQFSGNGSTTAFTLSYAPAGSTSIIVSISGVVQNPNTYSVSGTTLTFTPAPPTGTNNIAVLYLGLPVVATLTPGNTAYFSSSVFTATASQTVFTPSGTYQTGFINVIRNGSQLAPADYTATNGTTVTLANPCTAGDTVVIEVFNLTSISGALPLTGGTVTGATTFNSNVTVNALVLGYNQIGSVVSVTGATTLTSTAFGNLHQCSGTSADYTVVLPAASGNAGKIISFQMSTALTKLVTLDGNASETIDGALTRVMWAGETAVLYCDGTAWTKIGGKTIPMVAGQTVSGTQSIATGTSTKKTLGTATGYANCPSAMNDTANSRIVILRAGNYLLQGCTRISNLTATTNQETLLYVNSSEYAITSRYATSGDFSSMICDVNYAAAANAVIELYARQYSGVNQTYLNNIMNYLFVTEIPQW